MAAGGVLGTFSMFGCAEWQLFGLHPQCDLCGCRSHNFRVLEDGAKQLIDTVIDGDSRTVSAKSRNLFSPQTGTNLEQRHRF